MRIPLSRDELAAVIPLAVAVSLRMLGLFLLLPVLAPHVLELEGGSWQLAGYAVGAYGLTQAVMLIPLGWLSDRIGRRPVIAGGMIAFAAGGLIAAVSDTPQGIIAGRALQGAGAVSAAALAAIADATTPAGRPAAMGVVGIGIAGSFGVAILISGPLAALIGVSGLLYITVALGLAGAGTIWSARLPAAAPRTDAERSERLSPALLLPCSGVFAIHAMLAGLFVYLSVRLFGELGHGGLWLVYGPAFLIAVALAIPFILRASALPALPAASMAVLTAAVVAAAYSAGGSALALAAAVTAFFAAFCILEAMLPAMAAAMAPPGRRGAAMGMFAVCQAAGAFAGASAAGWAETSYGIIPVSAAGALLVLWALISLYFSINKRKDA